MAFTMKSFRTFFLIFVIEFSLIYSYPSNSIEEDDVDIDVIDLSRFGEKLFGDPNHDVGKMVNEWTPESGQNPEELGTYVEGDILIPSEYGRNGLAKESSRWKNRIVPYVIHSSVPPTDRQLIKKAIDIYEQQTCIRFVPRTNEKDYVSVESSNTGCWSSVGRVGGKQIVNLQSGGCTQKVGTILHEFLHALGFYHEQNRPNRDNYIRVLTQNIKPETLPNFDKAKPGETIDYGVQYDLGSVMHYSSTAFSRNGAKTIVPLSGAESKMGQRDGFSRGDLIKLNAMYQCDNIVPNNIGNPGVPVNGGNGFNQVDPAAEKVIGQRTGFSPGDLTKINARYCSDIQKPDDRLPHYPEQLPFYPEYGNAVPPLYPEYGAFLPNPPLHPPQMPIFPPPYPNRPGLFGNRPFRPNRPPFLGK
ncbi:hypothetical protein PVAND_002900 [Polypedilum vanderplanki]|uniref:Metalloendopeptidase n=1 Tax=Polypedilum vanderplanki TaxID=319348 RepID=A0A9J6BSX6_POLVA|nr:hypothetical protein PVAND_002900 [Polypedilum vanderplanki]